MRIAGIFAAINPLWWRVAFPLVALILLGIPVFAQYLHLEFSVHHFWVLLLPFILYVRKPGQHSFRYGWVALAMLVLYLVVWKMLFLFLGICFLGFFIVESQWGKLNTVAPVVMVLVTPAAKYVFDLFGFSIRMQLTQLASGLMRVLGFENTASGSLIAIDGAVFAVDEACSGLKMVVTTFLVALVLVSWFEKRHKRYLPLWAIGSYLLLTFGFVVISNLARISGLILFEAPEGTALHELIGLAAVAVFGIIPCYAAAVAGVRWLGKPLSGTDLGGVIAKKWSLLANGGMLAIVAVLCLSFAPESFHGDRDVVAENIRLPGFSSEQQRANVTALKSAQALVYVKPISDFIQSEHHPSMCWAGSGYRVTGERIDSIGGKELYTARLVGPGCELYTAWWYENGSHQTVSQLDWRWRMLWGENRFRLVNVTCENPQQLFGQCSMLMDAKLFAEK